MEEMSAQETQFKRNRVHQWNVQVIFHHLFRMNLLYLYYKGIIVYGELIDFYSLDLKLDGNWASWTSWSSCSPECFQHRRRTCTNPPPRKPKGRYCFGRDLQSRNCTDGFCQGKQSYRIV